MLSNKRKIVKWNFGLDRGHEPPPKGHASPPSFLDYRNKDIKSINTLTLSVNSITKHLSILTANSYKYVTNYLVALVSTAPAM